MICQQSRAFTLVELLISVAIIIILLALLVPGLSSAMEYAERATCASNLATIGRGIGMYAAEYKVTPQRGDQPGTPAGDSWDNGFRAGGGRESKLETNDPTTAEVPAEQRPLYKYAGPDAFECPNDEVHFESRGFAYESLWEARGSSYWMQPSADEPDMVKFYISYFAGSGGAGPFDYFKGVIGRKFASIGQPHKLVLMSDAPAWYTPYSFGAVTYSFHDERGRQETAEGRNHAWNNVLFADGHSQYLRVEGVQDDFVTSEYSFAWNVFDASKKGSREQ